MLRKAAVLVVCSVLVACAALAARWESDRDDGPRYQPAAAWLQLPQGFHFDLATAVATDKYDNLFVAHRGTPPIIVFDKAGRFLRSWGDRDIAIAHGLRIDRDGHVWMTDLGTHQVIEYDSAGNVLLRLGTRNRPGDGPDQFNMPADVAVGSTGDIYVADGYGNARVVVFSRTGKYLRQWGRQGTAAGEFNCVHGIAVDDRGRILVADRDNERIQVFDSHGKFLAQWRECGTPSGLFVDRGRVLIADGRGSEVRILDGDGRLTTHFGARGDPTEPLLEPHGICIDSQGAIYIAEGQARGPRKLVPH
jgi:DNA-binding beta-propeller fold protein YncE